MFLVFPLNNRPDWRKPPLVTLLIILINCIVFFGPQGRDEQRSDKAAEFYVKSALPGIEIPLYLAAVKERGEIQEKARANHLEKLLAAKRWGEAHEIMDSDRRFMPALLAGNVVRSEHPRHAEWTAQRARYAGLRGERFTDRWLLVPNEVGVSAVTATFLHGNTGHLVGNMVFLFAFGYTVEMALGGSLFLLFYLLAGIGGSLTYLAMYWGSPVGSLGASGAVSGLMAMYAVLYGTRRIRFFYQLFFYFDYVKAPAIILLPVWIANELIQNWLFPHSGVAYMVHAGGLASGALLIWLWRRQRPNARVELPEAPREDSWEADLARARTLLEQLRIDEAKVLYARLSDLRPDRLDVLTRYFGLAKLAPGDEHFHRCAARAFALAAQDEASTAFVRDVFNQYLALAQPRPRLTPEQLGRVGLRLARAAAFDEAIRIEAMLTRLAPQLPDLNAVRLALVASLVRAARRGEAQAFAARIQHAAPESSEYRLAAQMLTG